MTLQVYIAQSGARLETEPAHFSGIDDFKNWVASNGRVSVQNQICLNGRGKSVRAQMLLTEHEVFVYNRLILNVASSPAAMANVSQLPMPPPHKVEKPPDTITDQNDVRAWQDLFKARKEWALSVVENSGHMSEEAQARYEEVAVIRRSLHIAVLNLAGHVSGLMQKFVEAETWAQDIITGYEMRINQLDQSLDLLRLLPSSSPILHYINAQYSSHGDSQPSLGDLLNMEDVQQAKITSHDSLKQFRADLDDLRRDFKKLSSGMDRVAKREENGVGFTPAAQSEEAVLLLKDAEAIAIKIQNDFGTLLGYSDTQKSISQASKTALLHTRNFLPNLSERCMDMSEIVATATKLRNRAAVEAAEIMQGIATLNTMCTDVSQRTASLEIPENDQKALELLLLVERLPIVYASFIAEAIRRREWAEKLKTDSSTLANEMANFQDEESKRRKKWQKNTGYYFWQDNTDWKVTGLEVNLLGEEGQWPMTSREDLQNLIDNLHSANAKPEIISEVSKILYAIQSPTKQQARRAKAFKNGSFHEAAIGRSTLLVRGDDDLIRTVQDEKSRVESKLRGAESRVRKLESLLHQHSQTSRVSAGHVFQLPSSASPDDHDGSNILDSPQPKDEGSRPVSVASGRLSANRTLDEKPIAQRVVSLEAELIAERERAAGFEKEAMAKSNAISDLKHGIEEATSTKKDLFQNLEAQRREFVSEHKSLEQENRRLVAQLEDYEDNIDRVIGSRENDQLSLDERLHEIRAELAHTKAEAEAQSQKAQGQVDFLRNDAKLKHEMSEGLEKELGRLRDENEGLVSRADSAVAAKQEDSDALHAVYSLLYPSAATPPSGIAEAISSRTKDIVKQLDIRQQELKATQSDRDAARKQLSEVRDDLATAKERLTTEEADGARLRDSMSKERAKSAALQSHLAEHQEHITNLKAKIAEGENGRVEEGERKIAGLNEELACSRTQIGSLQEELRFAQAQLQTAQGKYEKVNARLDGRTTRTKELTQRLYAQNERMLRLLDRLYYSVSREGDAMVITRVPRTERVNANDSSDPGSAVRRSGQVYKPLIDSDDLDFLDWMRSDDPEVEAERYNGYLSTIGSFDIETFCETIVKRIKDTEHQARKATRDARMYREKSHAAAKEAHEKIAYKHFKEGDLALFLPTRNQTSGAWAAFNVGAPHYFLREQDSHRLRTRDWLLARIHKVEDRVVDLSKSMTAHNSNAGERGSIGEASVGDESFEDDNPFDLSDGLRWYLIDAVEEKPGAPPLTPSLGKSTVAPQNVDAKGSIRHSKNKSGSAVHSISKTLNRSLDSRRSSNNSRRASPLAATPINAPMSVFEGAERLAVAAAEPGAAESVASEAPTAATDMSPMANRQQKTSQPPTENSESSEVRRPDDAAIDSLLGP